MADEKGITACAVSIRPCLEKLFANHPLQEYLISSGIEVLLAEYSEGREHRNRVRFILSGAGVWEEVDCKFEGFRYSVYNVEREGRARVVAEYRFNWPNTARALAYAMARASGGSLDKEELEEKLAGAMRQSGGQLSFDFGDGY